MNVSNPSIPIPPRLHPGIVIVDDNRIVREAIAQLLEEHRFSV